MKTLWRVEFAHWKYDDQWVVVADNYESEADALAAVTLFSTAHGMNRVFPACFRVMDYDVLAEAKK